MRILLTIWISLTFVIITSAQEICNNSIDDDGDGLIDIQDSDCDCDQILPSGLIPNESFEEISCIPQGEAEYDCADEWQQAGGNTADFFHANGLEFPTWINPNPRPPQEPLPDGNGYVGFRDGRSLQGGQPNYKEYVGACLTEDMEVGKTYNLDFFLGFADVPIQTSIDMTIYATTECSNIPFTTNPNAGCPGNFAGWDILDQKTFTGQNEWINVPFDLVADKPYSAIILGGGCDANNFQNNPYFFVDRLRLVEKIDFLLPFSEITGSLCEPEITLTAEPGEDFTYQWYQDGIALSGETSIDFTVAVTDFNVGEYSVVIGTPEGCLLSESLNLELPILRDTVNTIICQGEVYSVGTQTFMEAGNYEIPLISTLGCDSLVTLNLDIIDNPPFFDTPTICEGGTYEIAGEILTDPGNYSYVIPGSNANGCDSFLAVILTVNPSPELTLPATICDGQEFLQDGTILTAEGVYPFTYPLPTGCDSTVIIDLTVNDTYNEITPATICEGASYLLGNIEITETGIYPATLTSINGCDSIITLNLTVASTTFGNATATICNGESIDFLGESYDSGGDYEVTTSNNDGCDSIISLTINEIIWIDGVILPLDTIVDLGDDITITPAFIDPAFTQVVWTNAEGNVLANEVNLSLTGVLERQDAKLIGVDEYGCTDEDSITIRVNRNIGIYTPNIFSPNGDGNNDFFRPTVNKSIASLKEVAIYDRWGNLVYITEKIDNLDTWKGWNGKYKNNLAITGVYVYVATLIALDGGEEMISGDVTLIR